MSTADPIRRRERFSHLQGGPAAAPRAVFVAGGAWVALHTALTLLAGHGLFLLAAVTRHGMPGVRDLGGASTAPFVLVFLAAVPASLVSLALRSRFQGLSPRVQSLVAVAAWVAASAAFGGYLWRMLAG